MNSIIILISSIVLSFSVLYILNSKKNKGISKSIIFILLTGIILLITRQINIYLIKVIVIYITILTVHLIIFKEDFFETNLLLIVFFLFSFVSEVLLSIIIIVILKMDAEQIKNSIAISYWVNILMASANIMLFKLFSTKINKYIKIFKSKKLSHVFLNIIFPIISVIYIFLEIEKSLEMSSTYFLVVAAVILVLTTFILNIINLRTKDKIEIENKLLMTNIKGFEEFIERTKIKNHENKNKLIIIKDLVKKDNKKLLEYLAIMEDEVLMKDNKLILETAFLPDGIRSLIYSKMLKADNLGINYKINISKSIKNCDLFKDSKNFNNIATALGVYLDNAIEAASKTKNRILTIEMYKTKVSVQIIITNTFEGSVDLDKILQKGYSTKNRKSGYGLFLLNNKLSKVTNFERITKIVGKYFIQELIIKEKSL